MALSCVLMTLNSETTGTESEELKLYCFCTLLTCDFKLFLQVSD